MIEKLTTKNKTDILDFVLNTKDIYHDFYITKDKQRLFLTDTKVIEKILKYQTVYGLFSTNLQGILVIYREKGYRPYIKILSKNKHVDKDLIRFLLWNLSDKDLYMKLKKSNPLTSYLQLKNKNTGRLFFGFEFSGDRGEEILLYRKGQSIRKMESKDDNDNTD